VVRDDLHLTDEHADLLLAALDRVKALREIRALLKPYPEPPPAAAPRQYEPPSQGRYKRRR
jgi:hypothetical protein